MAAPTKKQANELRQLFQTAADDPGLPDSLRKKAKRAAKEFGGAVPAGSKAAIDIAAILALITKYLPLILQLLDIFRNRGGGSTSPGPV